MVKRIEMTTLRVRRVGYGSSGEADLKKMLHILGVKSFAV